MQIASFIPGLQYRAQFIEDPEYNHVNELTSATFLINNFQVTQNTDNIQQERGFITSVSWQAISALRTLSAKNVEKSNFLGHRKYSREMCLK